MAKHTFRLRQASLLAALVVAGCGGGGSSSPAPTTVAGSVVKGPVAGSQVCAYAATSAGKGTLLGCTTTNASGGYSFQIEASGDVVIEATGGTYTDEATSTTKTLTDPMQVVLGGNAGGTVTGVVTPLTSVAYTLARNGSGGVTSTNFGAAITQVATSFGLTGTNLATTVPNVTATPNDYGRMLRAISQFVRNGGTQAHLQATPSDLAAALQAAYFTINGTNITLNLGALTTASSGGSTGGTTGGTSGTSGTGTLNVSFAVVGTGVTVPSITIPGVAIPPAGSYCSSLTSGNAALASLGAASQLTVNSCTASGNTYTLDVTVAPPQGVPVGPLRYTVTYAFS